jgi:hypothetical protein
LVRCSGANDKDNSELHHHLMMRMMTCY